VRELDGSRTRVGGRHSSQRASGSPDGRIGGGVPIRDRRHVVVAVVAAVAVRVDGMLNLDWAHMMLARVSSMSSAPPPVASRERPTDRLWFP
jgi:hypothetical protein